MTGGGRDARTAYGGGIRWEGEAVATRAADSGRAGGLGGVDAERPITLAVAARSYPEGTHLSTIMRHVTRGIKTPRGVVRLEASRIGGRWCTTRSAIERFRAECTAARAGGPAPAAPETASRAKAEAYLDAIGLK